MKRTGFKNKKRKPLKRTKLRVKGQSTTSQIKRDIQSLLREIVILRDNGCWLRHYPEAGACGGYSKDGELILQAEHLHTRSNSASFADSRLVVCICQRHHIYWKPQYSDLYNELAEDFIGEERTKLWKRVREDRQPHKIDWKMEKIALEQELERIKLST